MAADASASPPDNPEPDAGAQTRTHWLLTPLVVWSMIAAFGPLGLPQLLLSPRFSPLAKAAISALVLLLTGLGVGLLLFIKAHPELLPPETLDRLRALL